MKVSEAMRDERTEKMHMELFYLGCREAYRDGRLTSEEDRLLLKLQGVLGVREDHAVRLGRLARETALSDSNPGRPSLGLDRLIALARAQAEASGLPRKLWWREHMLLRARLKDPARDPAPDSLPFEARLDASNQVRDHLFASLENQATEEVRETPAWVRWTRRGLGAVLALTLLFEAGSLLLADLTSARIEDAAAGEQFAVLVDEAAAARQEGYRDQALELLRKAERLSYKVPGESAQHQARYRANLEQARLLREISQADGSDLREEIRDAYEEALFELGNQEGQDRLRGELASEIALYRKTLGQPADQA